MTLLFEETRPVWLKEHEECSKLFSANAVFYMSNIYGKIRVTVCDVCGYEDVECLHLSNNLNVLEKTITCLLCGG